MNNTTRLLAIITALILVVLVAGFGISALRGSNAQANLDSAMEEMATATTEAELEKAMEKAGKAIKQGAKLEPDEEDLKWRGDYEGKKR